MLLKPNDEIQVRFSWRWEDDNKWKGRWLEERGTVIALSETMLSFKATEGETKIVPFSSVVQIVLLNRR